MTTRRKGVPPTPSDLVRSALRDVRELLEDLRSGMRHWRGIQEKVEHDPKGGWFLAFHVDGKMFLRTKLSGELRAQMTLPQAFLASARETREITGFAKRIIASREGETKPLHVNVRVENQKEANSFLVLLRYWHAWLREGRSSRATGQTRLPGF